MILLNGFGSFAGRDVNGSETLARHLAGSVVLGEPVVSEILDVIWGEPEARLPAWLESGRPVLALGLGEGSGDSLKFERRARNVASGTDEAGSCSPDGSVLRTDGEGALFTTMKFDPRWISNLVPAVESDNAGSFLCNAWLYTAIACADCPVAFVHLPVQGDTPEADYCARWAPAVREILVRNLSVE